VTKLCSADFYMIKIHASEFSRSPKKAMLLETKYCFSNVVVWDLIG